MRLREDEVGERRGGRAAAPDHVVGDGPHLRAKEGRGQALEAPRRVGEGGVVEVGLRVGVVLVVYEDERGRLDP